MDIHIKYFGSVRGAVQKAGEVKTLPESGTVLQLLQLLAGEYGEGFVGEVLTEAQDQPREDVTLAVNGKIISHAAAGEFVLQQGDALALFPVFQGGG